MTIFRAVYASTPFGFDAGHLDNILIASRANNVRDDITGALICRADLYLQWLEGPKDHIDALLMRIKNDDRHQDVRLFANDAVADRVFPGWAMRDDPARSWMWTQADVAAGAVECASRDDILAIFLRLVTEAH